MLKLFYSIYFPGDLMTKSNIFKSNEMLVYIRNSKTNLYENRTNDITRIYKSFYYGEFSGFNIFFNNSSQPYFYKFDNIRIFNFEEDINIKEKFIVVDNIIYSPVKMEKFEGGLYKITLSDDEIIVKNYKMISSQYSNTIKYFKELAIYGKKLSNEDDPLYYLMDKFEDFNLNHSTVLFEYLNKTFSSRKNSSVIITPFDYNESQIKSIKKALINTISIIEGPPGTGKTQTILNLVSNLIIHNKTCAIISNNNTAITNIQEKLSEEGYEFLVALLGNQDNISNFFDNNKQLIKDIIKSVKNEKKVSIDEIANLSEIVKKINETEVEIAIKQNNLIELINEKNNHLLIQEEHINMNDKLLSTDYLNLILRLQKSNKIRILERFLIKNKYKVNVKKYNIESIINNLEKLYYDTKILESELVIKKLNELLLKYKDKDYKQLLKEKSKLYFNFKIFEKYKNLEEKEFNKKNYKMNFNDFVDRYPIILSTSQSLINSIKNGFLFDYLIIDEASQTDLLSSVISMNCAKNLVIVGDSKQLEQIDEQKLFEESNRLALKYNVPSSFRYENNSILSSIKNSVEDVPTTLLKEHYRCVPDIINFCNKMFYDNELVPMTTNNGVHIEIIKTVEGNHARKNPNGSGLYNQREIDEIVKNINQKTSGEIGVITPFKYHAKLLREIVNNEIVEIDTVHKFQGRQKDEIYISFVANNLEKKEIENENRLYNFLTNQKLLNVAISRGKNKITVIVSDGIYKSKNNIIYDFIKYTENLYGNTITRTSEIRSVFDVLYQESNELNKNLFIGNKKIYYSELVFIKLLEEILVDYKKIGYVIQPRLSRVIKKYEGLTEDECKYLKHPLTHVDFMFFNKITKDVLFVVELDGIKFHEQNSNQIEKDQIKNKVFELNEISLFRFKTNESNEKERLIDILQQYVY